MSSFHVLDTTPVILKKPRPKTAAPRRPEQKKEEDFSEIKVPEKAKLDISIRVAQARVANGFNTRRDLATALSIPLEVITSIETRKGQVDKQKLNKICQFLKIKST
jgi:ribosome-binding protein aMBF1 (putative translation factor)